MSSMEFDTEEMLDNSPLKKYSSELATQEKVIIRIKKQEPDIDIEGKDSSTDNEEVVSYTCEFVQKVDETKSESDESIESERQDENFIYPAITNSDDEDTKDVTWQPPSTTPGERSTRKHMKCLNPKVEKPLSKKNKCKNNKNNDDVTIKRLKKGRLPKTAKSKQVLEDIDDSEPATNLIKTDETAKGESLTKKNCDLLTPKVGRPRKGMATPKQRLARIIKIHKMIK